MVKRIAFAGIVAALFTSLAAFVPASAGGGGCHAEATTAAREKTVILSQACFMPNFARVNVGDTVTWINKDQLAHTVTGVNMAWGSQKDLYVDDRVSMRFTKAGTYPYYCIYHPGMAGAVLVGDANQPGAIGALSDVSARVEQIDTTSAQRAATTVRVTKKGASTATTATIAVLACIAGFGVGRVRRARARAAHKVGG